jgi:hypothetical protein
MCGAMHVQVIGVMLQRLNVINTAYAPHIAQISVRQLPDLAKTPGNPSMLCGH